ncbi:MAG: DUF4783 domain-containing protein [Rhodothermales bacterium]
MTGLARVQRWGLVGLCVIWLGGGVAEQVAARQTPALASLQEALASGDAHLLMAEASDRVEIALLGQSKLYSRAQAVYVMQDFFRRYPPEHFAFQNTSQAEGSWFATGQYRYKHAERPLKVYVRLRMKGAQWELREVRIEQRRRS